MPLNNLLSNRLLPAGMALAALAGALALQHVFQWAPCPLCIVQRLTLIALLFSLTGWGLAQSPTARKLSLVWVVVFALVGVAAAGAHLWLLAFPSQSSCGPGLALFVNRLVEALPGSEWLLEGAGFCDDTRYGLLGLPLPAWAAMAHLVPMFVAFHQHWSKKPL